MLLILYIPQLAQHVLTQLLFHLQGVAKPCAFKTAWRQQLEFASLGPTGEFFFFSQNCKALCWPVQVLVFPLWHSSSSIICHLFLPLGKPLRQIPFDADHHTCIPPTEFHLQCLHLHTHHHERGIQIRFVLENKAHLRLLYSHVHTCICEKVWNIFCCPLRPYSYRRNPAG